MSTVYSTCPVYQTDRLNRTRVQTDKQKARVRLVGLFTNIGTSTSCLVVPAMEAMPFGFINGLQLDKKIWRKTENHWKTWG